MGFLVCVRVTYGEAKMDDKCTYLRDRCVLLLKKKMNEAAQLSRLGLEKLEMV